MKQKLQEILEMAIKLEDSVDSVDFEDIEKTKVSISRFRGEFPIMVDFQDMETGDESTIFLEKDGLVSLQTNPYQITEMLRILAELEGYKLCYVSESILAGNFDKSGVINLVKVSAFRKDLSEVEAYLKGDDFLFDLRCGDYHLGISRDFENPDLFDLRIYNFRPY